MPVDLFPRTSKVAQFPRKHQDDLTVALLRAKLLQIADSALKMPPPDWRERGDATTQDPLTSRVPAHCLDDIALRDLAAEAIAIAVAIAACGIAEEAARAASGAQLTVVRAEATYSRCLQQLREEADALERNAAALLLLASSRAEEAKDMVQAAGTMSRGEARSPRTCKVLIDT